MIPTEFETSEKTQKEIFEEQDLVLLDGSVVSADSGFLRDTYGIGSFLELPLERIRRITERLHISEYVFGLPQAGSVQAVVEEECNFADILYERLNFMIETSSRARHEGILSEKEQHLEDLARVVYVDLVFAANELVRAASSAVFRVGPGSKRISAVIKAVDKAYEVERDIGYRHQNFQSRRDRRDGDKQLFTAGIEAVLSGSRVAVVGADSDLPRYKWILESPHAADIVPEDIREAASLLTVEYLLHDSSFYDNITPFTPPHLRGLDVDAA